MPIAAWCRFLAVPRPPAPPLVDPLGATLLPLAGDVTALIQRSGVFPERLAHDAVFRGAVADAHARMDDARAVRAIL